MSADTLSRLRSGQLNGITRLDLSCGLTEFPREIFDLADSLEVLNLTGNKLSSLPDDLPRLSRLRILFCSENRFTHLPEVLGRCPRLAMVGFKANQIETVTAAALPPELSWFILTDNRISRLPDELGRRPRLRKLMLSGNRLRELPETLAACENLELLRLAANRFEKLPEWLLALPRLAWLAVAGNPAFPEPGGAASSAMTAIPWHELRIQEKLGEGASGIISRAVWTPAPGAPAQDVAVKIFKGVVTSDGLPSSEMAACLAAGVHPSLTTVLGRLSGHPDDAAGLVMQLIPPEYRNLAGPPSLDSCTRDVYAENLCFPLPAALGIAAGVASAASRLHDRGILHGDLYAHNVLWNPQGHCLLGDFGAAAFYGAAAVGHAALQQTEVRAFGYLMEELLSRCDEPEGTALRAARALQERCLAPAVAERPLFREIDQVLQALVQA